MADLPPLPWVYSYQEDGPRLDSIVQRPVVPVALAGRGGEVSTGVFALVDSGCSHVLAAPWLADAAGVDPKASGRSLRLGIGAQTVTVDFADLRMRLLAPTPAGEDVYLEWECEVGFFAQWRPTFQVILGQTGFFNQFTVSMSQFAQATAIERNEAFDERYGPQLAF